MKRLSLLLALAVGVGIAARLPAADRESRPGDLDRAARLRSVSRSARFPWKPGPASLHVGAISNGQLLSYQWEPSSEPEPHRSPASIGDTSGLVPAVQWIAAKEWKPKDIRWFLADLGKERIRPLAEVMPSEAARLESLTSGDHIHAPHRWRWSWDGFWYTYFPGISGVSMLDGSRVYRVPLDAPHPGGRSRTTRRRRWTV